MSEVLPPSLSVFVLLVARKHILALDKFDSTKPILAIALTLSVRFVEIEGRRRLFEGGGPQRYVYEDLDLDSTLFLVGSIVDTILDGRLVYLLYIFLFVYLDTTNILGLVCSQLLVASAAELCYFRAVFKELLFTMSESVLFSEPQNR